ncbi:MULTISPECIES: Gfo/Idh/MocA family oxidoreductase [Bradyrhizobium]|uniref:Oxidoreductase n=1 Tax=Bradyrhizobium canariense TaxID=255045 RepID=A0ABX3X3R1_9BRAD|nr:MULTISPECIES: Gfo/Idh/MocA family oxidoreductase [Bradyrhizobium]MCK1438329.1 Gfo/Idh/MocA family oxidoreductase [Bradyrhizobium sp. 15]OSJ14110.1 oxidoreductase [Bradyrhizobium canariense]OSJ28053.1 oxidoreductase [Bradyrhizobium canariense]
MRSQTLSNKFALMGVAGYIAPRHLAAIRHVEGMLEAAFDPRDSVGVMDSYFPNAQFFVDFERFSAYLDKLKKVSGPVDYIGVCSPNFLHEPQSRFALRYGSNVICEKPLVLNPEDIDGLAAVETESGKKIFTILQLRLHDAILAVKRRVESEKRRYQVDLCYITSRGQWYHESWKGDDRKSGGVATNIGVHFFDMLSFIFGGVKSNEVHLREASRAAGFLECERADVRWFLSIDANDLPPSLGSKRTYRSIKMDGDEIEFSEGFTELHNRSYEEIVAGRGFTLEDVRPSIEVVTQIRHLPIKLRPDRAHALLKARLL